MSFILRPYQTRGLQEAKQHLAAGFKRILMVAPTGAGKTIMFCKGIVEPAVAKGKCIWIVVPRLQLINQTCDKLDKLGIYHGVIQANHVRTRYNASVQVCSMDSLQNRIKAGFNLRAPDIIIIDEAHKGSIDNSHGQLINQFPEAIVVGFTATPTRLDGKGLGDLYQKMVVVATINELMDEGALIPFVLYRSDVDLKDIAKVGGDYNQKRLGNRMSSAAIVGNALEHWQKYAAGLLTVAFAVTVEHSKEIVDTFNSAGINAAHIDAHTPPEVREYILKLFEARKITYLCSVGVFTEGFDCPSVECVQFLRPTLSLSLYLQMAGRGIRPRHGKAEPGEHVVFLDHANLRNQHGYITQDFDWSLEHGRVQKKEKKVRRIPSCPACQTVFDPGSWPPFCPTCLLKFDRETREREIKIIEGELIRDTGNTLPPPVKNEEITAARQALYRKLEEKAFLNDLDPTYPWDEFRRRVGEAPTTEDRKTSEDRITWVRSHTGKAQPQWRHKLSGKSFL